MTGPDLATIRSLPKVLLHDHLDGGLRPRTVIGLAAEAGWTLPTNDPDELASWFSGGHERGGLEPYLSGFAHTVGVMQSREALVRVADECVADLAADGVVYAEVRFAPELHIGGGLSLDSVIGAVFEGITLGTAGSGIDVRMICSAIRTNADAEDIADLAIRWRDAGVVGFDLAGAEDGFPPSHHLSAFERVRRANFHSTIHAGEGFGLPSIWEALQICGGERLGHGVRLVEDIAFDEAGEPLLGRLASYVRDRRVAMELCPTSNLHTSVVDRIADHPIDLLSRLRFRVTVNTDNRLMSNVTLSDEFHNLAQTFGYGVSDIEWFTMNAAKSSFLPFNERVDLIEKKVVPGFDAVQARHLGHSVTDADLTHDDPLAWQRGRTRGPRTVASRPSDAPG